MNPSIISYMDGWGFSVSRAVFAPRERDVFVHVLYVFAAKQQKTSREILPDTIECYR